MRIYYDNSHLIEKTNSLFLRCLLRVETRENAFFYKKEAIHVSVLLLQRLRSDGESLFLSGINQVHRGILSLIRKFSLSLFSFHKGYDFLLEYKVSIDYNLKIQKMVSSKPI